MKRCVTPMLCITLLILILPGAVQARDPVFTPDGARVNQNAAMLNDRGVELYFEGRLEEALGSFIMASQADPSFPIAHFNCAVVLATRGFKGDQEEAIRHLEMSYRLDPHNEAIRDFLNELIRKTPLAT